MAELSRSRFASLESEAKQWEAELVRVRKSLGGMQIDETYFALTHRERQLASPWLDENASRIRETLSKAGETGGSAMAG